MYTRVKSICKKQEVSKNRPNGSGNPPIPWLKITTNFNHIRGPLRLCF